jgi:hypothetical protein
MNINIEEDVLPIKIISNDKEYDLKKFKKDWKKFYFTEFSIGTFHSVFFCNQCKFRFLVNNNTNLINIFELIMKAHANAHDECSSDSNMAEGYHVTGMAKNGLGEISSITVRQPNKTLAYLERVKI